MSNSGKEECPAIIGSGNLLLLNEKLLADDTCPTASLPINIPCAITVYAEVYSFFRECVN